MKCIVYTQQDGAVAICRPMEGARLALSITLADGTKHESKEPAPAASISGVMRGWPVDGANAEWAETEDEFIARIAKKDVPTDDYLVIEHTELPQDRTFRNAWTRSGRAVVCDMARASGIARDMLRAERAKRFQTLDGQWMRAMGRGETSAAAELEAKRETLRNWPADQRLPACSTPDALKGLVQQMLDEVPCR